MAQQYIIEQDIKSSHFERTNIDTRYCSKAEPHQVFFTREKDKAKKYDTIEEAKADMKRIFENIAYHVNIQYVIMAYNP